MNYSSFFQSFTDPTMATTKTAIKIANPSIQAKRMVMLKKLPVYLSWSVLANPSSNPIDMQAHTKSNRSMKSSSTPMNKSQKGVLVGGSDLLCPNASSLY